MLEPSLVVLESIEIVSIFARSRAPFTVRTAGVLLTLSVAFPHFGDTQVFLSVAVALAPAVCADSPLHADAHRWSP
eukprot:6170179-Pyramimonas_sp.AAC.1